MQEIINNDTIEITNVFISSTQEEKNNNLSNIVADLISIEASKYNVVS